jgi:hypothetical protein
MVEKFKYLDGDDDRTEIVLFRCGQWAVTESGLHCRQSRTHTYHVWKERLAENDWIRHMAEKPWVMVSQFRTALNKARKLLKVELPDGFKDIEPEAD